MSGELTLAQEVFPSITAFLNANRDRDNNEAMRNYRSSTSGTRSFTETNTYEEAERLFLNGYDKVLDRIKTEFERQTQVVKRTEQVDRVRTKHDVVGDTVSVGRYLAGHPRHMTRRTKVKLPSKTIHITYLCGYACSNDKEDIIRAGVTTLSAVAILEKMGYRVRLDYAVFMTNGDEGRFDVGVLGGFVAKDYRQPLDLLKLAFPLAHNSMFRRVGFRFMETCPEVKTRYSCYGRPLENVDNRDKWLAHLNEVTGSTCIEFGHAKRAGYDAMKLLRDAGILTD